MSDLDKLAEEILACNPKDEVYHVPYGLLAEEGTSVCEMERLQAMVREWQAFKEADYQLVAEQRRQGLYNLFGKPPIL